MPYRLDIANPPEGSLERLVDLGALDVDFTARGLAAIMPDAVQPDRVAEELDGAVLVASPAVGRDEDSTWVLDVRPVRVGRLEVTPSDADPAPRRVRLIDAPAFGTGLHPTTQLCLEALDEAVTLLSPASVLDVGTGSGVLALAALALGVEAAVGVDVSAEAIAVAAENARLNDAGTRLRLVRGGPEAVDGAWPLVLANIQASPLIEMAPTLVRRLGHRGRLVLSGIARAVAPDVERAYTNLGLRSGPAAERDGWTALVFDATW